MSALENQAKEKGSGHSILIKGRKLPLSLLKTQDVKSQAVQLLEIESFQDTFGKKARRKKPNVGISDYSTLIEKSKEKQENYDETKDIDLQKQVYHAITDETWDRRMEAGQSKRIWAELYKVLDSSDVLV